MSCADACGRISCPKAWALHRRPARLTALDIDKRGIEWALQASSLPEFVLALVAAGVSFYLYQRKGNGDTARLFAPRTRRLAYIERTALEGGRKLLLVRRDDVEHLILIGGPIDLVVESGIRSEAVASPSRRN